jgi:FMN reductase
MSESAAAVVALVASAEGGSTHALVEAVLEGARDEGAAAHAICLGHGPYDGDATAAALAGAGPYDALVLGTPMYRATFAGLLKEAVDAIDRRSPRDGFESPLLAKPVAIVGTGRSDHHFLGIDHLFSVVSRFFAAYVVPPGLYGRSDQMTDGVVTDAALRGSALSLGAATVALARAVGGDPRLAGQRPQI